MTTAARAVEEWTGVGVSLAEIEKQLRTLRNAAGPAGIPDLRTSVLTHIAWVPPEWEQPATDTLAGLAERHPSRTILLVPDPDAGEDRLDAELAYRCYSLHRLERQVCSEVVTLRLRRARAAAPASIVAPLLIADLPVFLRWRGRPPFGDGAFEQLLDLAHRLVVDSGEWPDVPDAYGELVGTFERAAVSDIAWARTEPWRRSLSRLWPGIAEIETLAVAGPAAEAHLLAGWLRSRLQRPVEAEHEARDRLERVEVDGDEIEPPADPPRTSSDLLSDELDRFRRDRIYEAAARAAGA